MNWLISVWLILLAYNPKPTEICTGEQPDDTRGDIKVTVVYEGSTDPIANIQLDLRNKTEGLIQTVRTTDKGTYHFEDLDLGTYTLQSMNFSKSGEKEVTLTEANPSLEVTVVLNVDIPWEAHREISIEEEDAEVSVEEVPTPIPTPVEEEYIIDDAVEAVVEHTSSIPPPPPPPPPSNEPKEIFGYTNAAPSPKPHPNQLRSANRQDVSVEERVAEEGPIAKEETKTDLIETKEETTSTFSIDVDKASYSLVRSHINNGYNLPKENIRVEELINYFTYDYKSPKGDDPFATYTAISDCPWNEKSNIVHIGLQGKKLDFSESPASNMTFLLDVSGSMSDDLELVKSSLRMIIEHMRPEDKIAIVVYAGAAGLVLPSTSGDQKETILNALNGLSAGGSTAGGAGIKLAYKIAEDNFVEGGNNRVILATDGDFNVGVSSDQGLEELIVQEREKGVFLTVLGFGHGNYQDTKMETLADKGNGNYAYIDNIKEAKKVLVQEMSGTLYAIAKDVKIQVEFNPKVVESYRLIGYNNRRLNNEDFADDTKDAGELGAGHTVTAIYEVIYHKPNKVKAKDKVLDLRLRYKEPDGDESKLIETVVNYDYKPLEKSDENIRWSAALASWGLVLREEGYAQDLSAEDVYRLAESAVGKDAEGERAECLQLIGNWSENAAQLEEADHHHED